MRFKKDNIRKKQKQQPIQTWLTAGYHNAQTRWAKWMSRRASRASHRLQFAYYILFTVLVGGYSMFLIVQGMQSQRGYRINTGSIARPKGVAIYRGGDTVNRGMKDNEFKLIVNFRRFMDSLARSPDGRRLHDSIKKARPGLSDSLDALENYYRKNFKDLYNGKN